MKNLQTVIAAWVCLSFVSAFGQMGGPRGGQTGMGAPRNFEFGGGMRKLFGNNSEFSADMEMQVARSDGTMTMPGKLAVADDKSRFEMDMSEMKGGGMPPEAAAQMKQMGMDKMASISLPQQKTTYLIYPGLKAYAVSSIQNPESAKPESDFKIETTELGKDTVDGHPCVKKKAVVTDSDGNKHESTIWTATDMKDFPIKIETTENGQNMTMLFKNVKFSKPDANLFEPPSDYTKYDNQMEMMRSEMMKRMGGGGMMPPGR